jgi:hypothetical protein
MHLLRHVISNIRRFSLLKNYIEEAFESNNTPLRNASVFSSRHSPSHDIGRTMEQTQLTRHVASGGYFYSPNDGKYVQAAPAVLKFVRESKAFQRMYGLLPQRDQPTPGMCSVKLILLLALTLSPSRNCAAVGVCSPPRSEVYRYRSISY